MPGDNRFDDAATIANVKFQALREARPGDIPRSMLFMTPRAVLLAWAAVSQNCHDSPGRDLIVQKSDRPERSETIKTGCCKGKD
jgi:hypothetical protein